MKKKLPVHLQYFKKLAGKICTSCLLFSFLFTSVIANASFQVSGKIEKVYYPENFTFFQGTDIYRPSQWNRNRYLRPESGTDKCLAGFYYFEPSSTCTAVLTASLLGSGEQEVTLLINGKEAGTVLFPAEPDEKQMTGDKLVIKLHGIDIPQYSEVYLKFKGNNNHSWGIEHLKLIPEGEYRGEKISLPKPHTLRVYNTIEEQQAGHSMLERFVQENVARQITRRDSVLLRLNTPQEWRAHQQQVRDRLSSVLGDFPVKTPLNPRITGRLDYPDYFIEKVIYESQPGYFIPANIYIPKNREFPLPGVLYTIGHWDMGKMAPDINKICTGLAKKGYVVLAADPIGQGERSEYFDPETLKPTVGLSVDQHHYVGRPALLAGWSLPGLRTWDCIKAVDYLVSRPEVDSTMLAVAGNSGGGQMALLAAAADTRIKVIAAAHPGGSCEGTYLGGRMPANLDLFSLIPPRPVRMITGDASGEEPAHRRKLEDMAKFYKGLGYSETYWDMDVVDGVHDNSQSKRESTYEWLNKWFGKTEEGKSEPPLEAEEAKKLQCTENGVVLASLGGESGQTLNQKLGEQVYRPIKDLDKLKNRILTRLKLTIPVSSRVPEVKSRETFKLDGISVEKFAYISEPGIEVPALLLRPVTQIEKQQVILHVSAQGKPDDTYRTSLPFALVREGYTVLSIDVRGTGETLCHPPAAGLDQYTGYTAENWIRDVAANDASSFNRTMVGMQVLDVLNGINLITETSTMKNRPVLLAGEGLGGLWALLAAAFHPGIQSVVTINTLPSYQLLLSGKYYNQHEYFYTPGVLIDFDIPDLVRLISSNEQGQLWMDPADELSQKMSKEVAGTILGSMKGLKVVSDSGGQPENYLTEITTFLEEKDK